MALVHLPTAVLEPRAVPAPPVPVPAPMPAPSPVYVPEAGDNGTAAPLGARRVVSRPADEPPVEQWRREGLADDVPPGTGRPDAPTAPPVAPPVVPAVDLAEPAPEPPLPPRVVEPQPEPQPQPQPQPGPYPDPEPVPTAFTPPPPPEADADAPDDFSDAASLPTRIPGRHLTHQPVAAGDAAAADALAAADADADPMRPYRVHELLTRHTQGKQRGRTGPNDDLIDGAPATTVPDAFRHAQEDGR